jgi:hypothetical protein
LAGKTNNPETQIDADRKPKDNEKSCVDENLHVDGKSKVSATENTKAEQDSNLNSQINAEAQPKVLPADPVQDPEKALTPNATKFQPTCTKVGPKRKYLSETAKSSRK